MERQIVIGGAVALREALGVERGDPRFGAEGGIERVLL